MALRYSNDVPWRREIRTKGMDVAPQPFDAETNLGVLRKFRRQCLRDHLLRHVRQGGTPAPCDCSSSLLLRSDKTLERLNPTCMAVGLFSEWDCSSPGRAECHAITAIPWPRQRNVPTKLWSASASQATPADASSKSPCSSRKARLCRNDDRAIAQRGEGICPERVCHLQVDDGNPHGTSRIKPPLEPSLKTSCGRHGVPAIPKLVCGSPPASPGR